MIIKRQKTYSGKGTKILFRLKKVADQVGTTFNNAGLKTGDRISQTITGKPVRNSGFKFRPKSDMQLKRETVQRTRKTQNIVNEAMTDPEGLTGKLTKKAADEVTKSPLSFAGKIAIDSKLPGTPTTTPYLMVSPIEQKVWDRVNQVGVGNYNLGRVTSPVKRTIRNVAEPLGRTLYRQGTML